MPKVFVVQVPSRREGGEWVPKYDLSAAEAFGELVWVLPPGNVPIEPGPTVASLSAAFGAFDFLRDHLLLLGDPVAIARAVAVLCARRSFLEDFSGESLPISLLKWDRRADAYQPVRID